MLITNKEELIALAGKDGKMNQIVCSRAYDDETKDKKILELESAGLVVLEGGDHLQGWKIDRVDKK
jgi:hypothetical protein